MKNIKIKNSTIDLLFRVGLSSFFIINSLAAWFSPGEFLDLLGANKLASAIAVPQFWVYIIGVNDATLAVLILMGRWRKEISIWASAWIIAVMYVTASEGLNGFVEHIGVLSFIAVYYFSSCNNILKNNSSINSVDEN